MKDNPILFNRNEHDDGEKYAPGKFKLSRERCVLKEVKWVKE